MLRAGALPLPVSAVQDTHASQPPTPTPRGGGCQCQPISSNPLLPTSLIPLWPRAPRNLERRPRWGPETMGAHAWRGLMTPLWSGTERGFSCMMRSPVSCGEQTSFLDKCNFC